MILKLQQLELHAVLVSPPLSAPASPPFHYISCHSCYSGGYPRMKPWWIIFDHSQVPLTLMMRLLQRECWRESYDDHEVERYS